MSLHEKSEPERRKTKTKTVPADRKQAVPWQQLFDQTETGLRAFLRNRLAQESDVEDCLQTVYVRVIESGSQVAPAARRAWLFRVAANESARYWRSRASTERMLEKQDDNQNVVTDPAQSIIDEETAIQIQQSLNRLPESWREIFRLRIEEEMTFAMIADHLQIPIGTALTRMRRCLERLRNELQSNDS